MDALPEEEIISTEAAQAELARHTEYLARFSELVQEVQRRQAEAQEIRVRGAHLAGILRGRGEPLEPPTPNRAQRRAATRPKGPVKKT